MLNYLKEKIEDLTLILQRKIEIYWMNLDRLDSSLSLMRPKKKIERSLEHLYQLSHRLEQAMTVSLNKRKDCLFSMNKQLIGLSPRQVLKRGYAIAYKQKTGEIIRSVADIAVGDLFHLQTSRGSMEAEKKADLKD